MCDYYNCSEPIDGKLLWYGEENARDYCEEHMKRAQEQFPHVTATL